MTTMRKCIGSAKFGIEAHDAPVADFPTQPTQRDGLGRLCKTHWTEYTRALRVAATGRQPAPASVAEVEPARADKLAAKAARTAIRNKAKPARKPEPIRTRVPRGRQEAAPEAGSQGDAG